MWRSQSDFLTMAREHNRDLVRQAEADRLSRHLSGTLAARIKNWWADRSAGITIRQWFQKNAAGMADRQVGYREQY